MSDTLFAYNKFHLGDCLQSLHLLRVFAKQVRSRAIVFFTNGCNLPQLKEVVEDLPNILLEPFESPLWRDHEHDAVDMWKNAEGFWEASPYRWNWSDFMLSHHAWTAGRMGQHSPFTCREHLLFDYPALEKYHHQEVDFLIINGEPHSGQLSAMREHGSGYLDDFVKSLIRNGRNVTSSETMKLMGCTISEIGALSTRAKNVVGVMTGPFWPCLNTHRHHDGSKRAIAMLDNGENLNMPHADQVSNVEELFAIARTEGWL